MINVIIPHYKHQCYLPDAIDGMLKQHSWLGNIDMYGWRALIFNDEPDVDINHLGDIAFFIHVFQDGKNKGQAARFNQGIKYSIGIEDHFYPAHWITFQGADDIAMYWRNRVCMEWSKDADVLYTDAIQLNSNNKRTYIKSQEFDIEALKQRNFIVASTVFVRTELAAQVLFDEDLSYGEDWLFYHKLHQAGARFKYVPIPTMYYRDYTSNIGVRYGPEWDENRRELIDRIRELYQ